MSQKIFASFDGGETHATLSEHCRALIREQRESWQKLREAYEVLKNLKTRAISFEGFSVLLYHNPARLTSATAAVGQKDVKDRPCFLCLRNLPEEQRWILYRDEYRILCNPLPVFPSHFTIAHTGHRPQAISETVDAYLMLAADLGKEWTTLYNGPRCGASAPDHLHFQALPMGRMPIEQELRHGGRLVPVARLEGVRVSTARNLGREVIVIEGRDRSSMVAVFARVLTSFKEAVCADDEPMISVCGFHDGTSWHVALFPRQKHRPDCFFREGDERIVVSPGAVEMAGVLVTPVERDFNRLDAVAVEAIYREVSLDGSTLARVLAAVE